MLERKDFGIRFAAAVIDAVAVAVVVNVLVMALGKIGLVVAALVYLGYPLIEVLRAQSPGKMILKLRVTAEDGSPATRDQLLRRAMFRWAPFAAGGVCLLVAIVLPFLAMLGNIAIFGLSVALIVLSWKSLQTTRQAFWDIKARTAVMGPAAGGMPVVMAPQAVGAPAADAAAPPPYAAGPQAVAAPAPYAPAPAAAPAPFQMAPAPYAAAPAPYAAAPAPYAAPAANVPAAAPAAAAPGRPAHNRPPHAPRPAPSPDYPATMAADRDASPATIVGPAYLPPRAP